MILVELCLSFLLGMLGPLAGAPMLRLRGGGWYAWSGVLLATWMASVSAVLVQRFPDWVVLYTFEAKRLPGVVLVVATVLLSAGAAWMGSKWVIGPILSGRVGAAVARTAAGIAACALVLFLARERIAHMATTFEYRHGLMRPVQQVTGFPGLASLAAIGFGLPSLGVLLLLAMESLVRVSRPKAPGMH
jgi:hypothetical protein